MGWWWHLDTRWRRVEDFREVQVVEGKKYVMSKAGKKWCIVSEQNFTIIEAFICHLCIRHFHEF